MTAVPGRRVLVGLAVALSAAFAVAVHVAMVDGMPRAAGAVLALVPLSLLALWSVRRSRHRLVAFAAVGAAAVACVAYWDALERHFPDIFYVEHAGTNLVLALLFGRTLAAGREPLVTTFARIAHGTLEPDVLRYTRRVTVAWTAFFVALFAVSSALYFGGPRGAWSTFANLLSPLLVGAMFVVEYAVRHRVLPGHRRIGILGGVRAFSRHFAAARFEAPR